MDDPIILTHVLTYYGFTTSRQRHTVHTFGFDTCHELSRQNDEYMRNLWHSIQTNNRNLTGTRLVNATTTAKKRLSSLQKRI